MNLIKIDTDKLRALIKNQGMNMTQFSSTIGHESSFLPKCLKRGTMQMHDIVLIRQMYETDIEYHPPKEPTIVKAEQMELDIKLRSHRSKAYMYDILNHIEKTRTYIHDSYGGLSEGEMKLTVQMLDRVLDNVEDMLDE